MDILISIWSNWGWVIFSVFVFLFCLFANNNKDLLLGDVTIIGIGLIWGQIRYILSWSNDKFGAYLVISGITIIIASCIASKDSKN